ncbi:MAG: hypothetical protein CYPHOPRED_002059 [Cyphobasidiales sp. Tagirdzhanova-0007]|nr:MAG: hypothetical protein CYPHOPRED_002059 [Cyphobasidiales sp. Tagirdzhanova-0007]
MASIAGAFTSPFRNTYRYMQRQAHENPAIFYSILVGAAGPIAVIVVPPIRKTYFGWTPPPRPPTTYPLPNRKRDSNLSGYDDEE